MLEVILTTGTQSHRVCVSPRLSSLGTSHGYIRWPSCVCVCCLTLAFFILMFLFSLSFFLPSFNLRSSAITARENGTSPVCLCACVLCNANKLLISRCSRGCVGDPDWAESMGEGHGERKSEGGRERKTLV